jgi:DNA-binding response OmpR family regulator
VARILIVEPHADIRALLDHVVRRVGHEPVHSDQPGDLLSVDAAVIEPGDPVGLGLARSLRGQDVPVIFTSIFPLEPEYRELDPAAYFVKPFGLNELEIALESALDRDRASCT